MESTSFGDRQEMNYRLLKKGEWLQVFLVPVPILFGPALARVAISSKFPLQLARFLRKRRQQLS